MAKTLSEDLRVRIIAHVEGGKSCRSAARHYSVSASAAVKLLQNYRRTGQVAHRRKGKPPGRGKLGPHRDWLIAQVHAEPDITMVELATRLQQQRAVSADPSNLSKLLIRCGLSYKKRHSLPQNVIA